MELEFSQDQRFKHKPKILQLIDDCLRVYKATPNTTIMGLGCVLRLLYWHAILKHTRKHFLGKYFKMNFYYETSSDGAACLYIYPYIEYLVHRFVKEWVKKDFICFDVGSHVGYYPLLCSSLGAVTHSFEANTDMVRMQKINLLINDFESQVTINTVAVSNKNGSTNFYQQSNGRALISSLYQDPENPGEQINVKSITLDSYIKENKIKRIDFLKVDVEGAETIVFAGLKETLPKSIIKAIVWESNYRAPQKERFKILELLTKNGFKHYALDTKRKKVKAWEWGDEDCLSIHTSVSNEFKKVIRSINAKYDLAEN